jgi:hypothetical protein
MAKVKLDGEIRRIVTRKIEKADGPAVIATVILDLELTERGLESIKQLHDVQKEIVSVLIATSQEKLPFSGKAASEG